MSLIITDGDMMSMFSALAKEAKGKKLKYPTDPTGHYSKEAFFEVFEKFGDERMRSMLQAFEPYYHGDWNGCAIARAFGEFGALNKAVKEKATTVEQLVMDYFHLSQFDISAIVRCYDNSPEVLKSYIVEWIDKKNKEGGEVGIILASPSQKSEELVNAQAAESSSNKVTV